MKHYGRGWPSPPEGAARSNLYLALTEDRKAWLLRIHAQLCHQGVAVVPRPLSGKGRDDLAAAALSPAGRELVDRALRAIAALDEQIEPLKAKLQAIGRRYLGPRALTAFYGIGPLSAVIIWAELGDCRRFRRSHQAVRFAGLDITVWSSDGKRAPGHLSHQGSPVLRWALYEAAKVSGHTEAPDHAYYARVRDRLGGKRAALSEARKLLRCCYHALRDLGDLAWQPLEQSVEHVA